MGAHQEIELKWALDEGAWRALGLRLRAHLGPGRLLAQRNRFFDTADLRLRRALLNLRLREQDGRVLMTCKRRVARDGGLHHHEEWEAWLPAELATAVHAGTVPDAAALPLPDPVRTALADAPLVATGWFANLREEFHHGDELLCLDRTDFGVRIDYELEIETATPEATAARWAERLRAWGIAWEPRGITKFARMLEITGGQPHAAPIPDPPPPTP